MTKTKKLDMELPKEGRFISSEFPILRENLGKLDQALITIEEKIEGKAPSKHTHTISDVTGLESALNGKMSADKTFTFADLSDIEGAKDAANNYVLYKSSNNNFTFGSAISLLGAHQHKTEDIVGLDDFRAKINEDLTAYGRLASPNEWQNENKFTRTVTMNGGLEIVDNSPFSAFPSVNLYDDSSRIRRHFSTAKSVVTRLSANGSMLKGPLTVDGEAVYTKAQVDKLITEVDKLIVSYTKTQMDKLITDVDKLIASLNKKPVEILMTESGTISLPDGMTDDTDIEIRAWGAGGGGGLREGKYTNSHTGSGGEGGQYVCVKVKGWQLKKSRAAQIGRGDKGTYGNNAGSKGGDTLINGIIRANGGRGGYNNSWGGASTDRVCYGSNDMDSHSGGGGGGYFSGNNGGGEIGGTGGNGAILLKFFI
ncbi:Bgr_08870 family protein [Bartonella raoultii]|uniref:Bgr_08870 family protein n=1 Tax=Bartonella raoultii TaxID=1457020 RepID=UPI001ABA5BC5|nr:Bgr_08870 family protein [Bartonella raoultii]